MGVTPWQLQSKHLSMIRLVFLAVCDALDSANVRQSKRMTVSSHLSTMEHLTTNVQQLIHQMEPPGVQLRLMRKVLWLGTPGRTVLMDVLEQNLNVTMGSCSMKMVNVSMRQKQPPF